MFFFASATIAANHPEMAAAVREMDEHLAQHAGFPLRADYTAELLRIEPGQFSRLMMLFAEQGVVKKQVGYTCPDCDVLIEHVPQEGDLWCDECERTVSLRGKGGLGVTLWQTQPDAVMTALPTLTVQATTAGTDPTVCIQFIGGDRGGATRPQVMVPREEKEIRDAVNLGQFRERFIFADPVHAASLDDVIACHRACPAIVHFAGHGDERSLTLIEDRDLIVRSRQLAAEQVVSLFANYPTRVRVVFFNACHSAILARTLTETGTVDFAIGVPGPIADDPAIAFAKTFYRQLSEGLSLHQAFEMARLQHRPDTNVISHELCSAPTAEPTTTRFGGFSSKPRTPYGRQATTRTP